MSDESRYGRDDVPALTRLAPPEHYAERRRLAAALNRLASQIVRVDAGAADLARWADAAEALSAEAGQHMRRDEKAGHRRMWHGEASLLDIWDLFDFDSVSGESNAIAPGLRFGQDLPTVVATVNCGLAYQGPPGCVHGGVIAWIFDALLSRVQHVNGLFGMTGSLSIRYLAPTPIETDLRGEAEVQRMEGRKAFITGRLIAGETVTAEAEGVFILPKPKTQGTAG